MKTRLTASNSGALARFLRTISIAGLLPALFLLLSIQSSGAGSATWKATPATGDWNSATNWTPSSPPNGPADTATFATSSKTSVSTSANTEVSDLVFNAGASAFRITANPTFTLTISGASITNNSGISQNFVALPGPAAVKFTNNATAGSQLVSTAQTQAPALS